MKLWVVGDPGRALVGSFDAQELKNGRVAMLAAMGLPAASWDHLREHGR